jgi:hypothetical protein
VDEALEAWADLMLGNVPHLGRFEQHFLPLDVFEEPSRQGMPANINRYILRTIDLDAVRNPTTAFVLCKMGKFFVLGFVDVQFPKHWIGTKVHVRDGLVGRSNYTLPRQFGEYVRNEAEPYATIYNRISTAQCEKIEKTMWKDIDRVAKSGSFNAMKYDVNSFGQEAFTIHRPQASSGETE